VTYSEQALDALAILMTAVKVLYLGGAISRAAEVVKMIEPARRASCKLLHTTLIRNEAAYCSCISQLLQDFPPPPTPQGLNPLFQVYNIRDTNLKTMTGDLHMYHRCCLI
jgi:hypothetical protein